MGYFCANMKAFHICSSIEHTRNKKTWQIHQVLHKYKKLSLNYSHELCGNSLRQPLASVQLKVEETHEKWKGAGGREASVSYWSGTVATYFLFRKIWMSSWKKQSCWFVYIIITVICTRTTVPCRCSGTPNLWIHPCSRAAACAVDGGEGGGRNSF